MADRAVSDDDSPESIVDLFDSDRWQARLEEARARREIALREKGKDPSEPPKRKLMPWEEDAETALPSAKIEPIVQDRDTDRVDFADRVEVIRETKKEAADPKVLSEPSTSESATVSPLPTSFDDLLTYDAYEEDDLDWAPPPKKPHSAINEDAPDVIELASRYASTLSAVPDSVENEQVEEDTTAAPVKVRTHPPALLIVGIVLLATLPFAETVPPLDKGPDMPAVPSLRLQPALGFTTAMLWRPAETSATDWSPAATWSLPLSTVFSPPIPALQTTPDVFMAQPGLGQDSPEFNQPVVAAIASRSTQPPALGGTFVDRLPGTFLRRPEPRPVPGEPVADTRAPQRPPEVASGNETSPRVAPVKDADSTLLNSVTALEAVSFDSTLDPESAVPAINTPERVLQLTILVPEKLNTSVAAQFADDAEARGHEIVSVKDVNLNISSRNLRYFHGGDRAEAERLAKAYDAELRDFTWFSPKPGNGTVELWLEGRASAPQRVARPAPVVTETAPERVAPTPTIVVVRKSEGLFSRIFGGHKAGAATVAQDGSSGSPPVNTVPSSSGSGSTEDDVGTGTGGGDTTTGDVSDADTGTDTTGGATGGDTSTGGDASGTGGGDTSTGDTSGGDTSSGTDTSGGSDTSSGGDTSGSSSSGSGSSNNGNSSSNSGGASSGGGSSGDDSDASDD